MSYRPHFARFLSGDPARLHVAAHSHHPWPDVTVEAQQQAWHDAADLHDEKWERILGVVIPEARSWIASRLGLPDPATVAVAPNTHEFVVRLLSCLPTPARVLTTDGEFHSAARQFARLEEDGLAAVERVPTEPLGSFSDRLARAAARGGHDLVFVSHVLFDSGAVTDPEALVAAVPDERTFVVVDGYHAFMALPVRLTPIAQRCFYLAGGYKYAMAGEGACFLHCPPGYGRRPRDTGWFAGFAALEERPAGRAHGPDEGSAGGPAGGRVSYPRDGGRFLGATFDATGWYRFNAVQRLLDDLGLDVAAIHAHVGTLQRRLLGQLDATVLAGCELLPPAGVPDRGHFLTFRTADAGRIRRALRRRGAVSDHRGDRLRIGLGLYHDPDDVDDLVARLTDLPLD